MIATVPKTALFIAAFDSQLKWCGLIRDALAARGFTWRAVVPDVRSALSAEQIQAAGFTGVEPLSWEVLVETAATSDVVVSSLSGPLTHELLVDLADRGAQPGPVVVSGWVGVIIEKITAGYLDRCAADVVAVSSRSDLAHFHQVALRLGLPTDNLLLSGLPLLRPTPRPARTGPVRRVLFADQPTVPQRPDERLYLYRRLVGYAAAHPDRQVVLKPRHRPAEDTFHRMLHHPERLLAGIDPPPNFAVDYTPIVDQLPRTDLLITVSSTACLEAIDHGCRVGLVLDLGIHERYGNQVLLDSGLLRTFDQIADDDLGTPDPGWRESYFFPREGSAADLIGDRVEDLLSTGARPSAAVRQTDYFTSAAVFHRSVVKARRRGMRPRRGPLRDRINQVGHALLPPVLRTPLRRMAYRVGAIR